MGVKNIMAKKQSFEKAMEKLEVIVQELDSGDSSLDTTIKKFEEGIKLSKYCSEKLDEMEQRISVLVQNGSGEMDEKPLDFES
jgi:exodeoxyribonuclease VII small subunit